MNLKRSAILLTCGAILFTTSGTLLSPMSTQASTMKINQNKIVEIKDPVLKEAIKKQLNLTPDEEITYDNIQKLTDLNVSESAIKTLEGLENAHSLKTLYLYHVQQFDGNLAPIAGLTELTELNVGKANITDLLPLKNLSKNMVGMSFEDNPHLTDNNNILGAFTHLKTLSINNTAISNLDFLKNMYDLDILFLNNLPLDATSQLTYISQNKALTKLSMNNLALSSLEFIRPLQDLQGLSVKDNHIVDFRPLTATKVDSHNDDLFSAENQSISLPEGTVGLGTHVSLYLPKNDAPVLKWNALGDFVNNQLTWHETGVNTLDFSSNDNLISGTIQQVIK